MRFFDRFKNYIQSFRYEFSKKSAFKPEEINLIHIYSNFQKGGIFECGKKFELGSNF